MVQLGFTRAATGYWHRVTLPRWKFEEDPRHKKFVVSLVTALKTVIAALQTDRSSWPFSATLIVMRKTVSLVARNKFVNRDTATNGDGICWKRFEYAACGRENFRIRKKIFAETKISGYMWTWPKFHRKSAYSRSLAYFNCNSSEENRIIYLLKRIKDDWWTKFFSLQLFHKQ